MSGTKSSETKPLEDVTADVYKIKAPRCRDTTSAFTEKMLKSFKSFLKQLLCCDPLSDVGISGINIVAA